MAFATLFIFQLAVCFQRGARRPAAKPADVRRAQESGGIEAAGGDKEVSTPAAALQHVGRGVKRAGTAVIESEKHGRRVRPFAARRDMRYAIAGNCCTDRVHVTLEFL